MLVTKKAPDFTATAVLADGQIVEDFNLYDNIGEKGAVFIFLAIRLLHLFVPQRLLHSQKELKILKKEVFK